MKKLFFGLAALLLLSAISCKKSSSGGGSVAVTIESLAGSYKILSVTASTGDDLLPPCAVNDVYTFVSYTGTKGNFLYTDVGDVCDVAFDEDGFWRLSSDGKTLSMNDILMYTIISFDGTNVIATTDDGTTTVTIKLQKTTGPVGTTPIISSITPSAPVGTEITITGSNFAAGATVTIGGVVASGVNVVSATKITAMVPAGTTGVSVPVKVTVNGEVSNSYNIIVTSGSVINTPIITSVTPSPTAAGSTISITGNYFAAGATVTVGGVAATGVTFVNATKITAVVPSVAAGTRAVQVTVNAVVSNAFNITIAGGAIVTPTITAATSPVAVGAVITITGTNFANGAAVTIGGVAAAGVNFVSATKITAIVPSVAAGTKPLIVTVNGVPSNSFNITVSGSSGGCTPTMSSLAGTYKPIAIISVDAFTSVVTDIFAQFEACQKDDIAVLNSNGTYVSTSGATVCPGEGSFSRPGTWNVNGNQFVTQGDDVSSPSYATIQSFDCITLVYTVVDGFTATTITMRKQ